MTVSELFDDEPRARRPGRGAAGLSARIPPHNLEAEESLLGAMLLSRDAIAAATEVGIGADDFYKPAHGHIFDAVRALYSRGDPVDPVTVAEILRRADLLEAVGGAASLVTLQTATPSTTGAARYARIVEEHALLRRLIRVAGEISESAYDVPDDVPGAIDRAESLVYEVAQRRMTDSVATIGSLLNANLDRLEQLYARDEAITGLPTGYGDLDEILAGLQPSNLVVVGARPAMGKALDVETPIPTPSGWTTMACLNPGDEVFDGAGGVCRVTYVSPVYADRTCYAVEFDDGSVLVADADHQWRMYDFPAWKSRRDGATHPRVVTTQQMLDEGVRLEGRPNWYVPLAAIETPQADLPVDPYVLGCWLADGTTSTASMTIERPLRVPATYLRGSFKQRLALVQGVMDTDGTINEATGVVELCLANRELLEQLREVACSIGHKPGPIRAKVITRPDGRETRAWRLAWTPLDPVFRLERKATLQRPRTSTRRHGRMTRRAVVAIRPVPSRPVRCITVDAPTHTYLAGESMIPTHNTAFALGLATHAAVEAQRPVLVFSLEMSQLEVSQRILCAEARVDSSRVRTGRLTEADWAKISHSVGRLADAPIYIDDNANVTVMDIRAKARRLRSQLGDLGAVVVDYVQLMTGRSSAENRQVEVSEISRNLKILAREIETPVVALAQLNRQLEQRADKRPMLSDLRESGSLEQDSDVVLFLYRDEVYNDDSPDRGTAEVIVAKHRNGPVGKVRLAWLDHYTKFANMAKV
ncbi:MAG: replicative DNA helicase [Acidimicrobiales bacterium]